MRKVKILGAAFIAVLAFGALTATAASAASPAWDTSNFPNGLASALLAVTEGTWSLAGLGIFGVKLKIECNGKLVGTVGPGAADEVTEATDLSGKKLISCKIIEKALCEGTLALFEAEHLPGASELVLNFKNEVIDHFTTDGTHGLPAFDVRCLLSGAWSLELCEGLVLTDPLVNNFAGVLGQVLNELSSKCNNSSNIGHFAAAGVTKLSLTSEILLVK